MLQNLSPDSFNNIFSFLKTYQKVYTKLILTNSSINETLSRIEYYQEFVMYHIPTRKIKKNFKNISFNQNENIKDSDFEYFKEVNILNMRKCNQNTITDKAFLNLKNLHTLDIRKRNQNNITDKTLQYFKNIPNLIK